MIAVIIIAVLIVLAGISLFFLKRSADKEFEPVQNPIELRPFPQYKYGLYFHPVAELERKMPIAPDNHLWEIKVVHDDGQYGLSVGLYSLVQEAVISETVYNLSTYINEFGLEKRMPEYYAVSKAQGKNEADASRDIIEEIIPKMVEWAEALLPKELPVKQLDELDYVLTAGLAPKHKVV